MSQIGTPGAANATKVLLLGSGELGKEVCIELKRLGCEVIAVDRYANAPAMHVAHRSVVLDMLDPQAVRELMKRPELMLELLSVSRQLPAGHDTAPLLLALQTILQPGPHLLLLLLLLLLLALQAVQV